MELTIQSEEFSDKLNSQTFDLSNKHSQSLEKREKEFEIQLQKSIEERNEYYRLKIADLDDLFKFEKEISLQNYESLKSNLDGYKVKFEACKSLNEQLNDKILKLQEEYDSLKINAQKSVDLKSKEIQDNNERLELLSSKLSDQNEIISALQIEMGNLQAQLKESKEQVNY